MPVLRHARFMPQGRMVVAPIQPTGFDVDGRPVSAAEFIATACDPHRSVVVEACAGSGKTWLLVARMLRLLLAGAAPSEMLAITFTRKAAQEMRERLMQLLRELALLPEPAVLALLCERGISTDTVADLMPIARGLYERVLSSPQGLSIDTFHSWFARLLQLAPLAAEIPQGFVLTEATAELAADATARFMHELNQPELSATLAALQRLYQLVGDGNAGKLLQAFVDKRTEWWAASAQGVPFEWLQQICGEDGLSDARLRLWEDDALVTRIRTMCGLLGQGAKPNQDRAMAIEIALTGGASLQNFSQILTRFMDDKAQHRANNHRRGKLLSAIQADLGEHGADAFEREFMTLGSALALLQRRSAEATVLAVNAALFTVGSAYLDCYQTLKAEQRVVDFSDLEWQAYRLLGDGLHAAYLHSRMDTRYKHILLDEFQDTNPLQWSIVRAWLAAYGGDADAPSVFIVGDPKQSIYRFRRAEPRVFAAAQAMLAEQGAAMLRTNQTRRNAVEIVDVLNNTFDINPLFSAQTTLSAHAGAVWRLPLVQTQQNTAGASNGMTVRDALSTPLVEEDDARRLQEGRVVALAIRRAMRILSTSDMTMPRWSDVMLLVKKRAHLHAYETALREAGIPFVSDKRGGLLESIEIADLIALLTFLITPGDNRAVAHVLKSPIIGADDAMLILLAQQVGINWWQRLQHLARQGILTAPVALLQKWLAIAPRLPVHDLLDLILHDAQLVERYVVAVPALLRSQVVGNLEAFTELALNLDAGRYPSLPKFIDALRAMQRSAQRDAPDEARIDVGLDAVRILTIHSAKGLEAGIVVLLDANHSEPARDDLGILCEWPQSARGPTHFSAFGKLAERGAARDALFAEEARHRLQEDWNLLYVAVTRAKRILIVSGVVEKRQSQGDGVVAGSWYARLMAVPETLIEPRGESIIAESEDRFDWPVFAPAAMPPAAIALVAVALSTPLIEEGIALHALLERLTQQGDWPIRLPDVTMVARWLDCPLHRATVVLQQSTAILATPALQRFFDPSGIKFARNEMELVHDGELLRIDRVVALDDAFWILDYKRQLLASERTDYAAQLLRYRRAAEAIFVDQTIRTALITVDGVLHEFDDDWRDY